MPTAPPTAYLPGTQLTVGSHEVEIIKYVSEGGFAHVYTVRVDPPIAGHPVACLKRVAVPDKVYLNLLRAEVEAMQRLKGYSNIVQYFDSHAERMKSGMGYEVLLLMEYCAGGGLINFMNTRLRDQLKEHEILKIMYDITLGIAHMHHLHPPLIHRDLKIENVLLTGDGTYKLCDFGSVSPVLRVPKTPQEYRILDDDIKHHTTVQYRSPEMVDVYLGYPIDEKSDIWALGVFLYKLCFYTTPFEREGNAAILKASYIIPQKPAYSDRLKNMIRVLLQPVPTQRPTAYQVMQEICAMRDVENPLTRQQKASPPAQALAQAIPNSGAPTPGPSGILPTTSPGPMQSYPASPNVRANPASQQPVPAISLQPQPPYGAAQEILPMLSGLGPRSAPYAYNSLAASNPQLNPAQPQPQPQPQPQQPQTQQPQPQQPQPQQLQPLSNAFSGGTPAAAGPFVVPNPHLRVTSGQTNPVSVPKSPLLNASFESKFPVLSPTSPLLTGASAFDFGEAEVASRFPPMNELEPIGAPQNAAQAQPLPTNNFSSSSSTSLPAGQGPPIPRRPEELQSKFVREQAQARVQAARAELMQESVTASRRASTPLNAEEWSWEAERMRPSERLSFESEHEVRADSRDPRTSRSSGEYDRRKYRQSRSSGEYERPSGGRQIHVNYYSEPDSDSESDVKVSEQATKLKKIIGGMTESTVVLESDNPHVSSSVDFLRTLQPNHHHVQGLVRQISKGGKAAHARQKSFTNKIFGSSGHRRSQFYGNSDSEDEDDSDDEMVVVPRRQRGPADDARKDSESALVFGSDMDGSVVSGQESSDGSDYEAARRGSVVSVNSGVKRYNQSRNSVQHRVNQYLRSQQGPPSPRTARGYGRYTDNGTHSDSEVIESMPPADIVKMKKQLKRRTLTEGAKPPPLPSKTNKPALRKKDSVPRDQTGSGERRVPKPPKPAHLTRQSMVHP